MTERETYVENMKLQLDELDDQLSTFETKVTHARRDARERCGLELDKLRVQLKAAVTKWEELDASAEASWHHWVSDMDHLHGVVIHAFHDFKAHL